MNVIAHNNAFNAVIYHSNNYGTNNIGPDNFPFGTPVMFPHNREQELDNAVNQSHVNTFHTVGCLCGYLNTLYRVRLDNNRVYNVVMRGNEVVWVNYVRG
jgi:hypothetical protein